MNRILLIMSLLFVGCGEKQEVVITDLSKDTTFKRHVNEFSPIVLTMHVTGYADDTFMIRHISIPGGKVDRTIEYDWYEEDIEIPYKANNARKGRLVIKYDLQ